MSEKDNHSEVKKGNGVCRDFLRNVCRRGDRCKFSHPGGGDGADDGQGGGAKLQDKMEFCHDFQNNRCNRTQCRFIHCPADVETEFNKSGYLPPAVRDQVIHKGVAVDFPATTGGVPICKDYLKGRCARDNRCKFRHVNAMEYDLEMNAFQTGSGGGSRRRTHGAAFFDADEGGALLYKRRAVDTMMTMTGGGGGPPPQAFQMLQEENLQLRTQLQELEKRVSDLTATNEFLLDQNAQLRLGVKPVSGPGSGSASVAGVTVGPVGAGVVAVSGLGGPSSSYCY